MLKTSLTASSTTLTSSSYLVHKDKIDNRSHDEAKNSPNFFALQRGTRADYLTFGIKNTFNFFKNTFI